MGSLASHTHFLVNTSTDTVDRRSKGLRKILHCLMTVHTLQRKLLWIWIMTIWITSITRGSSFPAKRTSRVCRIWTKRAAYCHLPAKEISRLLPASKISSDFFDSTKVPGKCFSLEVLAYTTEYSAFSISMLSSGTSICTWWVSRFHLLSHASRL